MIFHFLYGIEIDWVSPEVILDQQYIKKTFQLAANGRGKVSPNPLVGAVLVKEGRIIGEGFHGYFGGPHAEVNAIKAAVENTTGATLYCNLEPCSHRNKKTPPCVDLILRCGVVRVVVSNIDPNPLVSGKEILRAHGIEFIEGILEEEGKKLNEVFFKFITTGKPFIHIKMAQTLDGKLCTDGGKSKWISGEESRKAVHSLREEYDAVLVGRKTLNQDNPKLTYRLKKNNKVRQPYRIVVGNPELMNLDSHLFCDEYRDKTWVVSTKKREEISSDKRDFFKGITVVEAESVKRFWENLWKQLAHRGVASILVEGGPGTIDSLLKEKQWDKMTTFISPRILGNGLGFFHSSAREISDAIALKRVSFREFGPDIQVMGHRD